MAVGTPVAGTSAQSNGTSITPTITVGMSVAADDIVVAYAVFYATTGTAPSAITWPTTPWTWAQGNLVQIKNSGGTVTGVAGWAWARATGSFNGTVTISSNGTTGATSGAVGQVFKMSGCITGEDPWEDSQANNPNHTTTVDWPAASMTRSTGGLSIILFCHSDNVNASTPANWTTLASNAGTQGSDSAVDSDYRAPGATGTYDPADGTIGASNAAGWATFHIIFTDTAGAGGPVTVTPGAATALGISPAPTVKADKTVTASIAAGSSQPAAVKVDKIPAASVGLCVTPPPTPLATVLTTAAVGLGIAPTATAVIGSAGVTATADPAIAIGSAPAPTVLVVRAVTASLAAGSSPQPSVAIARQLAAAVGLGVTPAPTVIIAGNVTVVVGSAVGLGIAPQPGVVVARAVSAALAAGATSAPSVLARVFPAAAAALGIAPTPTVLAGVLYIPANVSIVDPPPALAAITAAGGVVVVVTEAPTGAEVTLA